MNAETLEALRVVTAGTKFNAARNRLRQELIMTDALKSIIVEVRKLQNQIADVADPRLPWSPDNRYRVRGLAVFGNSGTGKTHAIETAIKLLRPVNAGGDAIPPKVITVRTPSSGTASALAKQIIIKAGLPISLEPKDNEAVSKVVARVVRKQPTMIYADEVSRCANPVTLGERASTKESGLLWNIAISLLDEESWPTPLVFTGLPCLIDSLYVPDKNPGTMRVRLEASRRFTKIRIPDATLEKDAPAIRHVIDQYAKALGVGSTLSDDDEIGARLIHASNYAYGTALFIAQHAVALAHARDGAKGKLKRDDFVAVYNILGGGSLDANIFDAGRWSEINPEVVLPESFDDAKFRSHDDDR